MRAASWRGCAVALLLIYSILWLLDGRLLQVRRYERETWVGTATLGSRTLSGWLLPQAAEERRIPLVPVLTRVEEVGPVRAGECR